MKIKRLSIHGFKSFVDKVNLNFSSGTSAIIGPNGCGKSNIVDAIRWVLGEQNARHLRGKLMEDVIFNGTENRKPLGMAEVVLTFSNEDGIAPASYANFTEIEIARRLYRSGESEYSINKVQSRLRDIVDLFTDTGIGTRAYSIIEQGQVGWLINAKPEDRRVIFEEAAGINKFKHKKEAALRKLEATKDNLTRVNDIISEVKRQLNSLNRQAKKAERYKALRDELQTIDLHLSSLEFKALRASMAAIADELERIKDEELSAASAISSKEAGINGIKVEYLDVEARFKGIRDKVFELERIIQSEEGASSLTAARIEELRRNEDRLSFEINEFSGRKEALKGEKQALLASMDEVSSFIGEKASEQERLNAELDNVIKKLREKEEAQRAERTESFKTTTRINDIRHNIQHLLREEENCRMRESKALTDKEAAERELSVKEEPVSALREKVLGSKRHKGSIEAELGNIKTELERIEAAKAGKESDLKGKKDEYARVSARLATLEEMERKFEGIKGGAKSIMLNARKDGVHGLIADVIEANPGYEKAVEAVMGERLQYVIVESHNEGMEAIEYLKTHSGGRGSFVPVRDARPANTPVYANGAIPDHPGVKELISEIKVKDGYGDIINFLLGDTLLVNDLQTAIDIYKKNGIYKTLVTPDGEIIDPQGIITGGNGNGSDAGILQKRGEIKTLKAKAQELELGISALAAELEGFSSQLASTRSAIEGLREKLHQTQIEEVNAEAELKRHEHEKERLEKSIAVLSNEITEAGKKLIEVNAKKAGLSKERDELESGFNKREETLRALAEELSSLNAEKERFNNLVTELRVSLASARERLEAVKRQAAEKENTIKDIEARLESKSAEIARGREEIDIKIRQIEEIKGRLEGLLSEKDSIKESETALGNELASLNERIQQAEAELKGLKDRSAQAQERRNELTLSLKESELGLNNLKEKIAEKYGADIETYEPPAPQEGQEVLDHSSLEARKDDLREKITSLGEVSLSALEEYAELERRHQFLLDQQTDLNSSVESLMTAISRINRTTRDKFRAAFDEINAKFQENFPKFFNGGRAELRLSDDGDLLEAGIDIVAQPPGKKLQSISLLSGGEKALTATALIFSIFLIKPSPFCLLDEVDAPLDDANIDRFNGFVKDMSKISQFMLITHNKRTMEMADTLFGVTMAEPGVSKIINMKF